MPKRNVTYDEQELRNIRRKARHDAKVKLRIAQDFEMPKGEQSTFEFEAFYSSKEEKCSECNKVLDEKEIRYTLSIKGKSKVYCQSCAKRILKPQEQTEEV